MLPPDELKVACAAIYAETALFHLEIGPLMGHADFGYKILYGPPHLAAPILFLGMQPGGGAADAVAGAAVGERLGWPSRCEYAWESYRLAIAARSVWSSRFLETCTGLNLNFFRAPDDDSWRELEPSVRRRVEAFCLPRARSLVELLEPKFVVVFGLGTFDRLRDSTAKVANAPLIGSTGRSLVRHGRIWGVPALGVMHLSGAQISSVDKAMIIAHLGSLSA